MSQFLPTVVGKMRREMHAQLNGMMIAAGLTPRDIVRSTKRYDPVENKTIVRLKFKNVGKDCGDLLLEVPGKH
jgi:hypothetical protein